MMVKSFRHNRIAAKVSHLDIEEGDSCFSDSSSDIALGKSSSTTLVRCPRRVLTLRSSSAVRTSTTASSKTTLTATAPLIVVSGRCVDGRRQPFQQSLASVRCRLVPDTGSLFNTTPVKGDYTLRTRRTIMMPRFLIAPHRSYIDVKSTKISDDCLNTSHFEVNFNSLYILQHCDLDLLYCSVVSATCSGCGGWRFLV